ncbi:MAG: SusC/RagA family TonB-linked outer membrane protein [Bacteroidota bacterium]
MKKILFFLFLVVLCAAIVNAQVRQVTGSVKDEKGAAVPLATIKVKGAQTSVLADENGNFKISAASNAILQITATGFAPFEISAGSTNLSVSLKQQIEEIDNIVVTAQGIRKKSKEIGYSYAKVSTEELMVGRAPRLTQALAGKVSGLAIYTVNNSVDPAVKVVLRGYRSLTGNNEALVVVDGMQTTSTVLATINPNDVETVTILKGGQAATLYGSAGVNGALVITTKQGAKGKIKTTYSNATNFEEISFMPQFQNKYGSGSQYYPYSFGDPSYSADYLVRMKANWRSYENQQYGDAYDGSLRIAGRVLEDGDKLVVPYADVPNVRRNSYDRGVSKNNQVSFSGGDDNGTYYLSVENQKINGIVPGDMSDRTGVRANATKKFGKLYTGYNVAYNQIAYDRAGSDFQNDVINTASWVDLTKMRDWRTNKFANPNGYYNDYYNNPYFNKDINRARYKDANLQGSFDIEYKFAPWISLYNRLGVMNNSRTQKNTVEKFTYTDWAVNDAFIPDPWTSYDDYPGIYRAISNVLGSVTDFSSTENVLNNEFQARIQKDLGIVQNKLTLGYSVYQRYTKAISVGSSSIVVPDVYNISNRQGILSGSESNTTERKYGIYGDYNVSIKDLDWLNLNLTGRYDATSRFYKSTRAANQYSYLYYGAALSAILTEAIPALSNDFLSYAKLRASYNKNGNDNIPLYGLDLSYSNGSNFPYGSNVGLTVGNTLPDANLKPEFVTAIEAGGEFAFLKNRINLDLSWYTQRSVGQVLTVRIPNSTGFSNLLINVGEVKNWGYEGDLKIQAIRSKNLRFDVNLRYSYNDNKVVSLYPGITDFAYGGYSYASTNVILGQRFPQLKTNGYFYSSDGSGMRRVSPTTGYPVQNTALTPRGSTLARHMAGFGSSLSYKDLSFTFNFEYRGGNVMYADLGRQMTFTGSGKWTENRTPHIFPNSYFLDAGGKETPNTTVMVREPEYALWVNNYRLISENFVCPGWFIKLRDVNLGYNLPANLIKKTKVFSNVNIALFGRNLFTIIDKKNFYTDPEFSFTSGNGLGISNTGQTPPVRQYGFNLNFVLQ